MGALLGTLGRESMYIYIYGVERGYIVCVCVFYNGKLYGSGAAHPAVRVTLTHVVCGSERSHYIFGEGETKQEKFRLRREGKLVLLGWWNFCQDYFTTTYCGRILLCDGKNKNPFLNDEEGY